MQTDRHTQAWKFISCRNKSEFFRPPPPPPKKVKPKEYFWRPSCFWSYQGNKSKCTHNINSKHAWYPNKKYTCMPETTEWYWTQCWNTSTCQTTCNSIYFIFNTFVHDHYLMERKTELTEIHDVISADGTVIHDYVWKIKTIMWLNHNWHEQCANHLLVD